MIREGVTWDLVVSRWLLCLFVDVLPIETVLRIWDVLFNEGGKTVPQKKKSQHKSYDESGKAMIRD